MARKGFKVVDKRKKAPVNTEPMESRNIPDVSSSLLSSNSTTQVPSQECLESDIIARKQKRVRGPTLMNEIWELDDGIKMEVKVGMVGIPVGMEASKLAKFLGSIVRRSSFAPIGYANWKKMEAHYKNAIWEAIEAKIEFMPFCSEKSKRWVMYSAGKKWKDWRIEIKNKVFDRMKTPEEMWQHVDDDRVEKRQFLSLCNIWLSHDHQKMCEQNRQNRTKLEDPHCTGTKTFARIIQEKKDENGSTPSRVNIYVNSRKRKDGDAVNEKAKDYMVLMKKYEAEAAAIGLDAQGVTTWQGDAYSKVEGSEKKGRIRCVGPIAPTNFSTAELHQKNLEATLSGVLDLVSGMVEICKQQFPSANFDHIIEAANQLTSQANAGKGRTKAPDARSVVHRGTDEAVPSSSNHF